MAAFEVVASIGVLLDRVVPVDQLLDDAYVDHALQLLGPYWPAGQ